MKKQLYKTMVELTQNPIYTKMIKTFTKSKVSGRLNHSFSKVYQINHGEMEREIHEYATLNDFFVRKLKPGSRPIASDCVVSPVDGKLSQVGTITEDATFHIKEKDYKLGTMLGLESSTQRYLGGTFMLFYLSPKDYHRIHSPLTGRLVKRWALGKYSEPVNQMGLLLGKEPLANNYRLITELEHKDRRMAMVKIGALNVNSVHPTHHKKEVEVGEELAYFSFGSSVILLFEKGMIEPSVDTSTVDLPVMQGQEIAKWL
ncbi:MULTISPECIES: phosphatidylserine decarboxylase [Bacillaceae]|uniref:phosphatidylserine decarboxylase n=1 Tax=Evansella alkalicola TaxID=745819 RepID=A0ABS6JVD1_9BACI|nr:MULTISPECIES: phosphatidylserine decarboxylase [Bacillaceae]MBU9722546.1 phosphatidylserine decarboxylase [Bacillus alkalicola]